MIETAEEIVLVIENIEVEAEKTRKGNIQGIVVEKISEKSLDLIHPQRIMSLLKGLWLLLPVLVVELLLMLPIFCRAFSQCLWRKLPKLIENFM